MNYELFLVSFLSKFIYWNTYIKYSNQVANKDLYLVPLKIECYRNRDWYVNLVENDSVSVTASEKFEAREKADIVKTRKQYVHDVM